MSRSTRVSRAVALADRVEASAGDSVSLPCTSCTHRGLNCIRSPLSTRCSNCIRSNYRCYVASDRGRNFYVAAVRADLRRLQASLIALDRSLRFADHSSYSPAARPLLGDRPPTPMAVSPFSAVGDNGDSSVMAEVPLAPRDTPAFSRGILPNPARVAPLIPISSFVNTVGSPDGIRSSFRFSSF